jgi:predicted PurR-regulated permease PerM
MRNAAHFCIVATAVILTLIYAQSLILPFVFAFGFWFLTREFRALLDKLPFFKKYFPVWVKNVFVFGLMVLSFSFIIDILSNNIATLTVSYQKYQNNMEPLLQKIGEIFHINVKSTIETAIGKLDFGSAFSQILNSLSGLLGNVFMIIIYALFLFFEEKTFQNKLQKVFANEPQYDKLMGILDKIEVSVFDYLWLKTVVSCLTGSLSFMILYFVGIDSPFFWAFLIFLLNYIPTIGSLVATIFPALFSLIQFGEVTPFLIVLVLVGAVQIIVGNVLEPKIMGKSLNLSPLVTIIALAIWGQLWGVTGMVLSVPITVIMVIVFSQFERTKAIAVMLSENGKIE